MGGPAVQTVPDLLETFRMRVIAAAALALSLTLAATAGGAHAQGLAETMLDSAKRMRSSAEQLRGKAPDADVAQLIRQAEEIETAVARGDYGAAATAAPPKEPTLAEQLMARHGRLDWLMGQPACAGYTLENYRTFRFSSAINDRDTHCRNAFGHYATYLRHAADPQAAEGAAQALFYYDAAARRAVEHVGGR